MLGSSSEGRAREHTPWLRYTLIGAAVVALVALIGVGGSIALGDDDGGISAEEDAAAVVQQFVNALAARDLDTIYALQADSYKAVCPRIAFDEAFASLITRPLEGPATVTVRGDTAAASLFEVQEDGSRERAIMPLVRENGEWRLARPSVSGCRP